MPARTNTSETDKLLKCLSQPSTYADHPGAVQLVETHISWVFLTNQHAYKLKKPLKLEFLDYSTPELRHRRCLDELRLNRRLTPDVYLAVVPITQSAGGEIALGGSGDVVDWVVQMKRLPADRALDVLLRDRKLNSGEAVAIARHLSNFYAGLPPVPMTIEGYRRVLEQHIRANGTSLLEAIPRQRASVQRVQGAQLQFLWSAADRFARRVEAGRIVEGHGDLRPEHIYLTTPPAIIDCVEFSADLRQIDIADELSFLAMECHHLGDGHLGEIVLSTYQTLCNDDLEPGLLAFYRSYRACVRAKVEAIRARQTVGADRRSHLRLANWYLNSADHDIAALGRPLLLMVGGTMGSGKSFLAIHLADAIGAELLSTDQIRQTLLGPSPSPEKYAEGHYVPYLRDQIYDELLGLADAQLRLGRSVVLDGTFLSKHRRDIAYGLGGRFNADTAFILCQCPRGVAISRIQQRATTSSSDSEARIDLYDEQAAELEFPDRTETSICVDTTQPVVTQLRFISESLRRLGPV